MGLNWRRLYGLVGQKKDSWLDRAADCLGFDGRHGVHDLNLGDAMMQIDNMADLPDGTVVVEAYAVIKVIDPQGGIGFHTRQTNDLSDWEALGMLVAASDKLRKQLMENWTNDFGDV